MASVELLSRLLYWLTWPGGFPDVQAAVNSDTGGFYIELWNLPGAPPSIDGLLAAGADPGSAVYANMKAAAATDIERIVLDWQLASVPLEKRSIYERKERLALNWAAASDEEQALAVKEFEGYAELMAEQGLAAVTLWLFDTAPAPVATLDDLLSTYAVNGQLYRLVMAEAEKWRNKYPMACQLLPVTIDPDTGHGLDQLEQDIAALKAEVQTKIAGVPAMIGAALSN